MKSLTRILALALLLAPLVLPQALGFFGVSEGPKAEEKRRKAEIPPASLLLSDPGTYGRKLAASYADNFPFRDWLIRKNNELKLAVFRESPVRTVIVGRDGWLFYNMESDLEDWLNLWSVSDEELDSAERILTERRDWLAAQGIAYLVVICPNKTTVYHEFLPTGFHKLGRVPRLDRLRDRLETAGLDFLDLRPAMRQAKSVRQAYWKTDTHWNDWGALVGSAAIVEALRPRFPDMPSIALEDYRPETVVVPGGDLARLMLLEDRFTERFEKMVPNFTPKAKPGPSRGYANPTTYSGREMVIRETDDPALPNALVFRDSFAKAAIPFLSERFNRSVYIWVHQFLPDIILAEKPDVVVFEAVERYQHAIQLGNPPLPWVGPGLLKRPVDKAASAAR
ncbi:hypothetical protein JCM15519_15670 [Fundidesulfovibrio butyratiphilus]